MHPELIVAVGVITNTRGDVLIARRPEHLHQGGLWEFPGGKVEPGESVEQALRRELREELDIDVLHARQSMAVRHAYPDRRVLLDVWHVERFSGEARGLESQQLRWVEVNELRHYDFPAANRPIVAALSLPDRYAILNLVDDFGEEHILAEFQRLVAQGVHFVQFRAKSLPRDEQWRLARLVRDYADREGVALLFNGEPDDAIALRVKGVHLTSQRLMALSTRPLDKRYWVAASCHTLDDLRRAEKIEADFAVLGPVEATLSHREVRPLGREVFRAWVAEVNLPVYALGGMTPDHIPDIKALGGHGISGIRGF